MRELLIEYIGGLFSGAALNMRNAEIKRRSCKTHWSIMTTF